MTIASRVIAATLCIIAFAACSGGNESAADSSVTPEPSPAATAAVAPVPTTPMWLRLQVGTKARLGSNGGDDQSRDDVYNSLDDLRTFIANGGGHVTVHPAGQIVRIVEVGPIVDSVANMHAVRIEGATGWTGWVEAELNLDPIPPVGTVFVLDTNGNAQPSYYHSQSDNTLASITVEPGTRARYLGFAPDPGGAEFHVKILNGAHAGADGYLVDLNLDTTDGPDRLTTNF